jgi:peptidyl-prolyl cis-trans isomerase B (cyclophilin B)
MKQFAALCLGWTLAWSSAARADDAKPPVAAEKRVVFHTIAGDLVFALYPTAAPKTVEQFLKLVQAGVYDTTAFARIRPGFIVQLGPASDRRQPLTPAQSEMIHRLPVEASALKHERGILSMARKDTDPESAETSFCILLGPAPQLDGKYTAFGRLESGEDVLAELLKVPRNDRMRPMVRLDVSKAEIIASPQALAQITLVKAHPVPGLPPPSRAVTALRAGAVPATNDPARRRTSFLLAVGILAMVALGGTKVLIRNRIAPRHAVSMDLVGVLLGTFMLLILLVPEGHRYPWLAGALFFGVLVVLKLLGQFEAATGK